MSTEDCFMGVVTRPKLPRTPVMFGPFPGLVIGKLVFLNFVMTGVDKDAEEVEARGAPFSSFTEPLVFKPKPLVKN